LSGAARGAKRFTTQMGAGSRRARIGARAPVDCSAAEWAVPAEASYVKQPVLRARVVGGRSANPQALSAALAAGGPTAVVALQRAAGNRAVTSLLQPDKSVLARCRGGCTCGGKCADEQLLQEAMKPLRRTASAPAPAQRLARGVRGIQRAADVCDPSGACCPAGTVGPDGTPNTGTDTIPTPDSTDGGAPQPGDGGLPPGGVADDVCENRAWPNGCAGGGGCDAGKTCVASQDWPVCSCW
jgi:hypothetical protein